MRTLISKSEENYDEAYGKVFPQVKEIKNGTGEKLNEHEKKHQRAENLNMDDVEFEVEMLNAMLQTTGKVQ